MTLTEHIFANIFSGNCFKAGRSYPEAEDAFKNAAEAHYNNNSYLLLIIPKGIK
jgi:3-isopropylmalate dehydratase small subunit